jgi:hypothetical protein
VPPIRATTTNPSTPSFLPTRGTRQSCQTAQPIAVLVPEGVRVALSVLRLQLGCRLPGVLGSDAHPDSWLATPVVVDESIRPVSWQAVGRVVEQGRGELFELGRASRGRAYARQLRRGRARDQPRGGRSR